MQPSTSWVAPIIQLVTTGGFGALLWYVLTKQQPATEERHARERAAQESRHAEERKADRAEFLTHLRDRDTKVEELISRHTTVVQEFSNTISSLQDEVSRLKTRP